MKEFSNRNTVDQHERYFNHSALPYFKTKTSESAIEMNGSLSALGGYFNASGGRLIGNMYGVCDTAAATTAKTVAISGFERVVGQLVTVKFTNYVPSSATLNINGTGGYSMCIKSTAVTMGRIGDGAVVTLVWSGNYYDILSVTNDNAWIEPTLLNGCQNFTAVNGGNYQNAGYMKDGEGFIHLRGLLLFNNLGDTYPVFNLPVGYRPLHALLVPAATGTVVGVCHIDSTGDVFLAIGSVYWYSMENIHFRAEQ